MYQTTNKQNSYGRKPACKKLRYRCSIKNKTSGNYIFFLFDFKVPVFTDFPGSSTKEPNLNCTPKTFSSSRDFNCSHRGHLIIRKVYSLGFVINSKKIND